LAIRRFNSILAVVLLPPCRTIAVIERHRNKSKSGNWKRFQLGGSVGMLLGGRRKQQPTAALVTATAATTRRWQQRWRQS